MKKPVKQKKRVHRNATIVPEGDRECPICREIMLTEITNGVKVDACGNHGVWLDRGELTKITRQIKRRMNLTRSIDLRQAKTDGKVAGSLFGIWSFLWD